MAWGNASKRYMTFISNRSISELETTTSSWISIKKIGRKWKQSKMQQLMKLGRQSKSSRIFYSKVSKKIQKTTNSAQRHQLRFRIPSATMKCLKVSHQTTHPSSQRPSRVMRKCPRKQMWSLWRINRNRNKIKRLKHVKIRLCCKWKRNNLLILELKWSQIGLKTNKRR